MRTTLLLIGLALIPAFAWILRLDYAHRVGPELREEALAGLKSAGVRGVEVEFDYLYAKLSGQASEPSMRDLAETIVSSLPGIRMAPGGNRIRVQASLKAAISGEALVLSGWLPGLQARNALEKLASRIRPELRVDVSHINLSTHVEIGDPVRMPEGLVPPSFQEILEEIRLPASFSIRREGNLVVMKGTIPTEDLRRKLAECGENGVKPVDTSHLNMNAHCTRPTFVEGDALATFAAAFLASPSPGDFEISERRGPRLRAHATPAMLASWLALLRPLTGGVKVSIEVTEVPSAFHFPDYRPLSKIPKELDRPLRQLLRQNGVTFSQGSAEIDSASALKIGMLASAITAAGPEAHFIVAGYGDEQFEPGSTGMIRVQRTEAVRNRLVSHGIPEELLESSLFNAVRPSGESIVQEDRQQAARRVELLVK